MCSFAFLGRSAVLYSCWGYNNPYQWCSDYQSPSRRGKENVKAIKMPVVILLPSERNKGQVLISLLVIAEREELLAAEIQLLLRSLSPSFHLLLHPAFQDAPECTCKHTHTHSHKPTYFCWNLLPRVIFPHFGGEWFQDHISLRILHTLR